MHSVWKIITSKMENEISYNSFKYFIDHDKSLVKSREIGKEKETLKKAYIKEHEHKFAKLKMLKEIKDSVS